MDTQGQKDSWVGRALHAAGVLLFVSSVIWVAVAAPAKRDVLAYGDSIVVGKGIDDRWASIVGARTDAKSGRALADDPDAAERIVAAKPEVVWIAIGTNDYGKSRATPAEFRRAYALLVDRIHIGAPAATIYAQTPLLRALDDRPNALGATLPEYRSAIAEVASSRPWLRLVDGTKIMQVSAMPDGLHPAEFGHHTYATFVAKTLQR